MPTLDDAQITSACLHVITRATEYQPLQAIAFSTLFATGCREGEVVQLWRWSLSNVGIYTLITEKGNAVRTFEASDLPIDFRSWIANRPTGIAPTSVDRLRSSFRQLVSYPNLTSGHKGISTHLFRYNYIRALKAAGATTPEIKAAMGLSSTTVINGYLENVVSYG